MNDSRQMLHDLVLEAMANDYESFDCILDQVSPWATGRGVSVTRREVAEAVERAILDGCAQAYLLSPQPPHSQPVAFSSDRLDDLWFHVTPKGMQRVKELETEWPSP